MKKNCWKCKGNDFIERNNHYECNSCGAITIKKDESSFFPWNH